MDRAPESSRPLKVDSEFTGRLETVTPLNEIEALRAVVPAKQQLASKPPVASGDTAAPAQT